MRHLLFTFIFLTALTSCSFFSSDDEKIAIARVGEEYLYLDDLDNFSAEESEEDSTAKAKAYIDSWIKEQLLLQKALVNLTEEQSNFDRQLKNYKNSLLIYSFENQLIKQKLDTLVRESEYKNYYRENKQNFKLREDIVSTRFVQYLNSAPEQDSLEYWLFQTKENSKMYLSDYCTQFAMSCHLDTSIWLPFTKIKELSQNTQDKNINLTIGKNMLSDSLQTILLDVYGLKSKGTTAPLSYVKEQIRSIIINKRKTQLISKVKSEIFEDATLKEKYEIFE